MHSEVYGQWKVSDLLSLIRVGSREWTWEEEWADLDAREPQYLAELSRSITREGIRENLTIGGDGRLWDGHHRLRVAVMLGITEVPVVVLS